ncbi:DUF3857 domain-containing protein [Myxococcota bacterium]|nr:DUF3857 domain-containing protein [Myxococcota bacterium]
MARSVFVRALPPIALAALVACSSSTPPPELERFDPMVTPGPDDHPDVPGVVLLDRGVLELTADAVTRNPIAKLRRLKRVKILRPSGAELSRVTIPYDPGSVVGDFVARAWLPNGDVVEAEKKSLSDTPDVSGRRAKTVKLQASEPGSIIEYTYDIFFSDPRFLPPWVFQSSLPTVRSELAVVAPPGFNLDLRYSRDGEFVDRPPERFETEAGTRFSWSESNLPARFSEPGMPTADLLSPRAHVVMLGARVGKRDYPGFASWDDVGAWFISRAPEWQKLSPETIAEAKRIAGETSPEEQALKLLAVVARDVAWESGPRLPLWQTRVVPPEIVLKEQRGNQATRGLLLTSLLRAVGLPAIPALVAYRDRGVLLPDVPTVYELDAVVAVIPRAQGLLVLDPTQLTVSADVPSARLQGSRIVALREDGAEVMRVPISKPSDSRAVITYDLEIDERGDLSGKLDARLTGDEAGELRGALLGADPSTYADLVSAFLKHRGAGLAVESADIADLTELRRPLIVKGLVQQKKAVTGEGTSVMVKVGRFVGSVEGETRIREVRKAPLRIGAPREAEISATVRLPEGWELGELAPPFAESWAGGQLSIEVRAETPRRAGVLRKSTIQVLEVSPREYSAYRRFRESVMSAEQRTFEVKRPPERELEY